MALIAATVLPTRQILMPAINRATDIGAKDRFKVLHGLSVVITLVHIALAGYVLTRFEGGLVAWRCYPAKTSSPIPVRLHWSLCRKASGSSLEVS